MKPLREAAVAGVLRTPFLKPGTSFSGVPEAEIIRLVTGELLFSSMIEPSIIDTVVLASSFPSERSVHRDVHSSCMALGFDRHFRIFSLYSGDSSDLTAIVETAMRISTGESEAAIVVGVGVGKNVFGQELPHVSNFPSLEVVERYPSTLEERESYVKNSIEKAREASEEGNRSGMKLMALPPLFEEVIDRDDLVETDEPGDNELPRVMMCDFYAPQREGVGALLLTTADKVKAKGKDEVFVLSQFKHLGVPAHLRGAGAAVALEALLKERQLPIDHLDELEIMETTSAQVLSSLKALQSTSPLGDGTEKEFSVNSSGGSLACGSVPSCSGIRMLAGLTERLGKNNGRLGALACEGSGNEALALLVERS